MSNSPIIRCQNVSKSYHDGTRELRILRDISMDVYEGEILAISGPSGVGKSTLLHIIGTLDKPSSGEVFYRNKALTKTSTSALYDIRNKEIGFVFQFYHLLPEFTALENVMMPALCKGASRSSSKKRALELIERVGLTDRMTHKPGQLSGGEQQRVAIARALYNRPAVVLSDEPTGNLDEKTGADIIELLWDLNKQDGMTLVIVTHDEILAKSAHRNIHISEGTAHLRVRE
jgi:lipoprotein-releasing system ATP-binding protein